MIVHLGLAKAKQQSLASPPFQSSRDAMTTTLIAEADKGPAFEAARAAALLRATIWARDPDRAKRAGLERPNVPVDRTRVDARPACMLWRGDDVSLRERAMWRLLYETAARANEILALDIEDLAATRWRQCR